MEDPTGPKVTMSVHTPNRDLEELARLGDEVFDQKVRPLLRPEDDGKFVALDLRTGAFEVDEDDFAAVSRLRQRDPVAEVWPTWAGDRADDRAAYRVRRGR